MIKKRMRNVWNNTKYYQYCLEYTNTKCDLIECKCLGCNENCQKSLMKFKRQCFLIDANFPTMI